MPGSSEFSQKALITFGEMSSNLWQLVLLTSGLSATPSLYMVASFLGLSLTPSLCVVLCPNLCTKDGIPVYSVLVCHGLGLLPGELWWICQLPAGQHGPSSHVTFCWPLPDPVKNSLCSCCSPCPSSVCPSSYTRCPAFPINSSLPFSATSGSSSPCITRVKVASLWSMSPDVGLGHVTSSDQPLTWLPCTFKALGYTRGRGGGGRCPKACILFGVHKIYVLIIP